LLRSPLFHQICSDTKKTTLPVRRCLAVHASTLPYQKTFVPDYTLRLFSVLFHSQTGQVMHVFMPATLKSSGLMFQCLVASPRTDRQIKTTTVVCPVRASIHPRRPQAKHQERVRVRAARHGPIVQASAPSTVENTPTERDTIPLSSVRWKTNRVSGAVLASTHPRHPQLKTQAPTAAGGLPGPDTIDFLARNLTAPTCKSARRDGNAAV
jgi:hypothetical protein